MHDAIFSPRGQNVPIRVRSRGGTNNAQRDSLSKSLPRIIPRKERFALLIEIEIITSAGCISWREMKRTDYPWCPAKRSVFVRMPCNRNRRGRSSSILLREIKFKSCWWKPITRGCFESNLNRYRREKRMPGFIDLSLLFFFSWTCNRDLASGACYKSGLLNRFGVLHLYLYLSGFYFRIPTPSQYFSRVSSFREFLGEDKFL